MKKHRWDDVRRKKLSPADIEKNQRWADKELIEMDLRAVRELVGKTQAEVAAVADINQSEVSMAERREDHRLSTLRRYIKALGGELEVIARFGDKTVRLHGV